MKRLSSIVAGLTVAAFSVQAEALDPSVLADIVRHNILSLIDVDAHQRALEWQMEQRQMLSTAVGGLSL